MDQLSGQQQATRLRDDDGSSTDVAAKKPPQLALADFEPLRKRPGLEIGLIPFYRNDVFLPS